jgi:hypothetical protein
VDLDGDGSVEILVSGYADQTYFPGSVPLRAYTNPRGTWPGGSSQWPEQTWSGTSREADGSIPRTARPPWLAYDHWRAQPETFPAGANLSPSVVDACATRCEAGTVTLSVRIENGGPDELPAGAPFAVYGVQDDGSLALLEVDRLPDWLDDGWTSPTIDVTVSTEQALRGLRILAGDDGTGIVTPECDVSDNAIDWAWEGCADSGWGARDPPKTTPPPPAGPSDPARAPRCTPRTCRPRPPAAATPPGSPTCRGSGRSVGPGGPVQDGPAGAGIAVVVEVAVAERREKSASAAERPGGGSLGRAPAWSLDASASTEG